MKKLSWCILTLLITLQSHSQASCPPSPPDPLVVETGVWGKPPALVKIEWPSDPDLGEAESVQIEFHQATGPGTDKLIYQRWFNQDELLWGMKHFFYSWHPPTNNSQYWFNKHYLIGSGPGKLRSFPAGDYFVRWRVRQTDCGVGTQESDWATTLFRIDPPPGSLVVTATGPAFVGSQDDLDFSWTNNFAASSYKIEIQQAKKVVRKATLLGGFGYFGMINSRRPGLEESQIGGGDYRDRPAYNRELPNGTGYVFRVSGFSPIAKKWSNWSEMPFEISRGTPVLPSLSLSQSDYGGFFDRSLRPFFFADYGGQTALWTYFDIQRRSPAGKLSVVRKLWVQRDNFAYGYIGGSGARWNPKSWQKDLPPGEYVWRVRAYNGPAPEQAVWTVWHTNTVSGPGVLDKPDATKISYEQFDWGSYVLWDAVPNAYAYKYEIRQNGKVVRKSKVVDESSYGVWLYNDQGVLRAESYAGKPLPKLDGYQIRVQAINDANPAGKTSEWSNWSVPFSLYGQGN